MAMHGIRFHTIDPTKIRGKGNFRCPECQIEISPDDQTENAYTILEPVMKGNCLEKLIIRCKKCGTHIQLLGFDASGKIG
jgi:predicted RNA-binding Zn-ribbon protein involved in translation (DUF1610 family)